MWGTEFEGALKAKGENDGILESMKFTTSIHMNKGYNSPWKRGFFF